MSFPRTSRRAFTLIEVMIAIMLFSLVIGAIYTSWIMLLRSAKVAQNVAAQAQRQRVTLHTLEDSLMGIQSFQASPQYYSFIVENGDTSVLSFTAKVPENFPRNGKFFNPNTGKVFDLRRLVFTVEAGADNEKNLVLRQNPVLMDLDDDEKKYPLVLAENVRKFTVECWDTNKLEWDDEWLDTNSIPTLLRVNLVVGGNTSAGSSAPDVSVARLFSMPAQMMPAAAQNGAGGGPPSPVGGPSSPVLPTQPPRQ